VPRHCRQKITISISTWLSQLPVCGFYVNGKLLIVNLDSEDVRQHNDLRLWMLRLSITK
jgi:hypothetical protein